MPVCAVLSLKDMLVVEQYFFHCSSRFDLAYIAVCISGCWWLHDIVSPPSFHEWATSVALHGGLSFCGLGKFWAVENMTIFLTSICKIPGYYIRLIPVYLSII